eukprot:15036578-Alexandrium_andersonii.AAC.1
MPTFITRPRPKDSAPFRVLNPMGTMRPDDERSGGASRGGSGGGDHPRDEQAAICNRANHCCLLVNSPMHRIQLALAFEQTS